MLTVALSSFSTTVLAVQLLTFAIFLFGVYQMKVRRNVRGHGAVQATATIISLATILAVMVPSLFRAAPAAGQPIGWMYAVVLGHHLLGLVALVLMVVLVGGWLASGLKPNGCPGRPEYKRKIMRATASAWVASIVLGIVVYAAYL